ncbi:hAT transposon superfamily protein [Striga asiatica]|uniref:HAT transposon superfamily protein n=1 Tax=Striga asiatica TaxID=4170 RepID=A0A5A7RGP4_STRAF|nr:hAT transposon superfamily protein [Striga asiatica]
MVKEDCRNDLKCKFCRTITKRGISRAKFILEMAKSSDNPQDPPKYPSNDPLWKYVWVVKEDCRNDLKSKFCGTITKGGISRAKCHIAGGSTSVKVYTKAPPSVVEEIKSYKLNKAATVAKKKIILRYPHQLMGFNMKIMERLLHLQVQCQ